MTDIWMGAGPVPEILHRILNLLAKARGRFGLPSLEPFSRLFYAVLNRMRFGEHRGGMFVRARGVADGRTVERRSEEHTSELQSLMRISYAVFCLKKKKNTKST